MRRHLEGSINVNKIVQLEDELKHKERVLAELLDEKESLVKVQRT